MSFTLFCSVLCCSFDLFRPASLVLRCPVLCSVGQSPVVFLPSPYESCPVLSRLLSSTSVSYPVPCRLLLSCLVLRCVLSSAQSCFVLSNCSRSHLVPPVCCVLPSVLWRLVFPVLLRCPVQSCVVVLFLVLLSCLIPSCIILS